MTDKLKALVLVADGCEEMETVIIIDTLRRAGLPVTVASLGGKIVTCSRQVRIEADALLDNLEFDDYAAIFLPGGMGAAKSFASNSRITALASSVVAGSSKTTLLGIMCASPLVLQNPPLRITSHPCVRDELVQRGHVHTGEAVTFCCNDRLLTGRGPGTTFEFVFAAISKLLGEDVAKSVRDPMAFD